MKEVYEGAIALHPSGSGIAQDATIGEPKLAVRLRFVDAFGNPYVLRFPEDEEFQLEWNFGPSVFTAATPAIVTLMGPRGINAQSVGGT
ncbi:MAG: hypothetical protein HY719_10180 [Planctomycetes bacterium]|nr:hypothetical protein [Planctomycetota bacterium]